MRDHVRSILILLFIFCTVTCTGPVASIENNRHEQGSGNPKIAALGKCRVTIVGTSLWRDWMPIVEHPGPDGGSPLHARIKLWMDNSAGDPIQISFQAVIAGDKARIYALPLHVLPNFRVLPEDVRKSFNSLDEKARKKILAQYNVIWDGVLKKGNAGRSNSLRPEAHISRSATVSMLKLP